MTEPKRRYPGVKNPYCICQECIDEHLERLRWQADGSLPPDPVSTAVPIVVDTSPPMRNQNFALQEETPDE